MNLSYIIPKDNIFPTVKSVVQSYFSISHRLLVKLKKEKKIQINDEPCLNINTVVKEYDVICIYLDLEEESENIVPIKMDLSILYEDDSFLLINKEAGIPVHPTMLHYEDSLANRCSCLL